ncbi:MAG TPA: plastocyanin/azurin family copper-binding protein [Opitutaceae bacterium]|nr:plastocyanin/azurin family copper-binding protein [Opitutaceae bacterium]
MAGFPALAKVHAEDTAVKTVVIVANDNLRFSITHIEASPGERLHIQLRNEGTLPKAGMGHNWILLKADANPAAFAMAAISASDNGYMPKALLPEVIASIPLLGPKEVGDVTFTCPTKPGKYPYICSCNGHSMAGMRGELIVK